MRKHPIAPVTSDVTSEGSMAVNVNQSRRERDQGPSLMLYQALNLKSFKVAARRMRRVKKAAMVDLIHSLMLVIWGLVTVQGSLRGTVSPAAEGPYLDTRRYPTGR